jgi:uncharacterized membrane protein YdjX (TVP38/TMEM64 family)
MRAGRVLLVALILLAVAAAVYSLPVLQWITALADRVRGTGARGVAIFFAAYVISTVLLVPGSLLTLAAGFAWGPVWGLAIASPSSVAGATAAFLLGRTFMREWVVRKTGDSARLRAIGKAVDREGFTLVLLLRLSPLVPFTLLNYALGLSSVRLGTYIAASAIGMLPATALYVYLGSLAPAAAQLTAAAQTGGASRSALYVAGLAATVGVVILATRAARRALQTELDKAT